MTSPKVACALAAIFCLAAGPLAAETHWISEPVKTCPANLADMKKVAILPFADYTQQQPYESAPLPLS